VGRRQSSSPTVKDIANRASVSIGTVSRVLNDHSDVGTSLRDRVEAAIRELGYRAPVRPESSRQQSRAIGFLLCNGAGINPIHAHLLLGIEQFCSDAGYYTIFTRYMYTPDQKPEEFELPDFLLQRHLVDCVIVAGANYSNFLRTLNDAKIRYVLLGNHMVGVPPNESHVNQVRYDDYGGCFEAARYLIQLGHKHIWYIGDTSLPWFLNRYEGYASAMKSADLEPHAHTYSLADDPFENGHAAVSYILERKYPVTALLCGSEELALGAREALRQHARDVPRDVSLIGFEHQLTHSRASNMTSVSIDTLAVGRELARMAISLNEAFGKEQPEIVIPATLVKRSTCRPFRQEDAMVL
jgi:DNA-binding LacI/PurR family transcriptional regulator